MANWYFSKKFFAKNKYMTKWYYIFMPPALPENATV